MRDYAVLVKRGSNRRRRAVVASAKYCSASWTVVAVGKLMSSWVTSKRQAHGLAGDQGPFQAGGGAGVVDGVQQSHRLRAEGVQACQVENERVVRKVEAPGVFDDLIDVARVDRTGDGHHRREVTALGPHGGAIAVDREVGVSRRQVRSCRVSRVVHKTRPRFQTVLPQYQGQR